MSSSILTTHVGSLPRSKELSELLFAKDKKENFNQETFNPVVQKNVEEVVYELLDLRQKYSNQTLADLYNPDSMPKDISEMLRKLDKAVFKSFNKNFSNEEQIIEYLFNMHNELTNDSR